MEDRQSIKGKLIATGLSGVVVLGLFAVSQLYISKDDNQGLEFQLEEKESQLNDGDMVTGMVTDGANIGDTMVSPSVTPLLALSPSVTPLLAPSPISGNIVDKTKTSPAPSPVGVTLIPNPSVSSVVSPMSLGRVVINEIAWMGTTFGKTGSDEWIELYNPSSSDISLSGWILKSETDDSPHILLSGTIKAGGYYLLERTDDSVVLDIKADFAGSFGTGGLNNSGEILLLLDKAGTEIDRVDCSKGWFYGDNTSKSSMERRNSSIIGNDRSNWGTNNGTTINGLDAGGVKINGTPGHRNSIQI